MRKLLLLLNFCFAAGLLPAQSLQQKLQTAFNKLQQDSQSRYASISLTVLDAKTGEQVFAANPNMGLAPASTLKTVTSITAFYLLGKDYRFKTTLCDVNGGTLLPDGTWQGDILINGGNDPTLSSSRYTETTESIVLKTFVEGLRKAGIRKISGSIIANGVSETPPGWIWQDIGNYFGAAPNALCWRENQYDIVLKPGKIGQPVQIVSTAPNVSSYLHIDNHLITGAAGTGDKAYAYTPVLGRLVMLSGSYAVDQEKRRIAAALPDPPYEAARRLRDTLLKAGIQVTGRAISETMWIDSTNNADMSYSRIFATHYSPPLKKVIYWLNQKSINLYAEQLLLAMADTAQVKNGAQFLQSYWKNKGIDPNALNIVDGSGLSPGDRVTTSAMAHILQTAKKEAWFNDFYESLPVYNNMKMKSGSINNVLCYAGYQTTKNGRELCFSIMVNNYNGSTSGVKQKMFAVLDELK